MFGREPQATAIGHLISVIQVRLYAAIDKFYLSLCYIHAYGSRI